MILPDLLNLASRADLTPQESVALALAITMLGGQAAPVRIDEFILLPHKIELIDGRLILT
jgi:hypothetical protein